MAVATRQNLLVPDAPRWSIESGKPCIELVGVSISFSGTQVLRDVNLAIAPGKTTVIAGRSGSGKSVLLKLMMGLARPDSGVVKLFGKDLASVSPVEVVSLRKRMSMLFQNYALLDSVTVAENVGFTLLQNTVMRHSEVMRLVRELLGILGLAGAEDLYPSELSGGMKKRVGLARALIANPEVVLFDEPTTGLDPVMIEKVDEMIQVARQQYQITSVIISHDMASIRRLADFVGFLHDGTIAAFGSYEQFIHSDFPPLHSFVEGGQTSRLAPVAVAATDSVPEVAPPQAPRLELGRPVVELVDVRKSFGSKEVLKGIDLKIYPGRVTVLIGASGSGKSVIIKHIMGLFKPDRGEVRVFGEDIVPMGGQDLDRVRSRIGLLFQHAALLDWLSVFENVEFPLKERTDTPRDERHDRVCDILERLHIADIKDRLPGEISEGQKKRVGLARAIVMQPEIVIYDEPTTGQDPIRTRDVDNMIQETQEQFGMTSIVISHDMASTFRIGHMIALLHHGEIAAYGTPDEVRASQDAHVKHFIYAGQVEV